MSKLSSDKQIQILSALVEGNSLRSVSRMLNIHRTTIMNVLEEAGKKAQNILDSELVNIKSNFIQVDEIWTYVGKKQKQLTMEEKLYEDNTHLGDQWTFVALDAETKLVTNYLVGKRSAQNTYAFMQDLNARVSTEFQLSNDSFQPYKNAVKSTFSKDIAYAQIRKQ